MKMKRLVALAEASWAGGHDEEECYKDELTVKDRRKASVRREMKRWKLWRGADATMKKVARAFGEAEQIYREHQISAVEAGH